MKARLLTVLMLLAGGFFGFAQEVADSLQLQQTPVFVSAHPVEAVGTPLAMPDAFRRTFSLEIGAGIPPLHYRLNSRSIDSSLAPSGQSATEEIASMVTLSGIARMNENLELSLTFDFMWTNCLVMQHETFGVDPSGQPRYDLYSSHEVGRRMLGFSWCATAGFRYIWNPQKPLNAYSGLSLGIVPEFWPDLPLVPGITFIGLRYGWRHFYLFAENTISPVATLVYGGLGWKF